MAQTKDKPTDKPTEQPTAEVTQNGVPGAPDGHEAWGLARRVAWVQAHMPTPPKNGHADVQMRAGGQYSYDYVTEPDMMHVVRRWCGAIGVAVFPSAPLISREDNLCTVSMQFTLACDVERGSDVVTQERVVEFTADGTDQGDKAINKAYTTAMRYFLQKQFQIETDGVDPERENQERVRGAGGGARRSGAAVGSDTKVSKGQVGLIRGRARDAGLSAEERDVVVRQVTKAAKVEDVTMSTVDKLLEVFAWIKQNPDRAQERLAAYRDQQRQAASGEPDPEAGQPTNPHEFDTGAADAAADVSHDGGDDTNAMDTDGAYLCLSCGVNEVPAEGDLCAECQATVAGEY